VDEILGTKKELAPEILNDPECCKVLSKIATIERLLDAAGLYLSNFHMDGFYEDMLKDIFDNHKRTCSFLEDLKTQFIEEKELGVKEEDVK